MIIKRSQTVGNLNYAHLTDTGANILINHTHIKSANTAATAAEKRLFLCPFPVLFRVLGVFQYIVVTSGDLRGDDIQHRLCLLLLLIIFAD